MDGVYRHARRQLEERRQGNGAYRRGDYAVAASHYTRAIAVLDLLLGGPSCPRPEEEGELLRSEKVCVNARARALRAFTLLEGGGGTREGVGCAGPSIPTPKSFLVRSRLAGACGVCPLPHVGPTHPATLHPSSNHARRSCRPGPVPGAWCLQVAALMNLAAARLALHDNGACARACGEVLQLAPRHAAAYLRRAKAWMGRGEHEVRLLHPRCHDNLWPAQALPNCRSLHAELCYRHGPCMGSHVTTVMRVAHPLWAGWLLAG